MNPLDTNFLTQKTNINVGTSFVEEVEANGKISSKGQELVAAFHQKSNPDLLDQLVKSGAPVNYRLDYGLEVKLEADFVFALYRILGGDEGEDRLKEGCLKVFGDHANEIFNYIQTAPKFFDILYNPSANQEIVPLSSSFIENLKLNPCFIRANPDHTNGSLIIAAGLRDGQLVKDLLKLGKNFLKNDNGAHVNFQGYFEHPAAVWSAILLDEDTLSILIDAGTDYNLSVCGSNLLHWACSAAGLDNSEERKNRAIRVVQRLVASGVKIDAVNKLGKTPKDYAPSYLKELIQNKNGKISN